jgi:hypothetical protein
VRGAPGARAAHLKLTRAIATGLASLMVGGCGSSPPPPSARPKAVVASASAKAVSPKPRPKTTTISVDDEVYGRLAAGVEYTDWTPIDGNWRFAAPKRDFIGADGGVDLAFHFHGAEMADEDWRMTGLNAVIVSVTLPGVGNKPYKRELGDPSRFGAVLDEVVKRVGATHSRRIALIGYSAGYAAVGQVLSNEWYYGKVDTAVLLDGLHASLIDGKPDERAITIFERFAADAVKGTRTMVVTHSSVVPPNYASTTQMTDLLIASIGAKRTLEEKKNAFGMTEWSHVDVGSFHLRGFRGDGPRDHMDQLRLLTPALTDWIVPRWTRLAVEEARGITPPSSP